MAAGGIRYASPPGDGQEDIPPSATRLPILESRLI